MEVRSNTLDFSAISRNGLSVLQSELAANAVGNEQIQANAVRVNELYIDGDLDFSESGTFQSIKGLNAIFYSSSKSTSSAFVQLGPNYLQVHAGTASGADLHLQAGGNVELQPGSAPNYAVEGTFRFSGATVFSGSAPTSTTTLDLSSYIGNRRAVVILRVDHKAGSLDCSYAFTADGGVLPELNCDEHPSAFSTKVSPGKSGYVIAYTDTGGDLDWKAGYSDSTDVVLIAWWA